AWHAACFGIDDMRIGVGIVLVLVLAAGVGATLIWSGAYDVAASSPHSTPGRWLFETARDRSIAARSHGAAPPALDSVALQREGFEEFDEMCVVCHGAPGASPSPVPRGVNPPPAHLAALPPQ